MEKGGGEVGGVVGGVETEVTTTDRVKQPNYECSPALQVLLFFRLFVGEDSFSAGRPCS